MQKYGMVVGE